MRTASCLGFHLHLIGPLGFLLTDRHLRRAHMDYRTHARCTQHDGWDAFLQFVKSQSALGGRLLGLSALGEKLYHQFSFRGGDVLLLGSEQSGLGKTQCDTCDSLLKVPMCKGQRSLNMAITGAMVMGEALRQTDTFPKPEG